MAGVRNMPTAGGKFQGWFVDYRGKRKFFAGTKSRTAILRMAERLEDQHRQIRLGYRPVPRMSNKYEMESFHEIASH